MMILNSLALRLFLSASVWIVFTLFSGGLLLSNVFRESSQKSFEDKLNLFMETLIGASKVDSTSSITVVNELGDPRFFQPYSGWYWQINKSSKTLVRSRSMWDQVLTKDKRLIGGRAQFINSLGNLNDQVKKTKTQISSQKLMIIQREISFPGIKEPLLFMVSGNTEEFEKNISRYNNILILSLVILGLGLLLSVFLQVKYGLLPLRKIKNSLFKIRNGDATKLEDSYPIEVSPLAKEINILLDHNEKIVTRAKTHVGNLAHALKTPIAVINNQNSLKKKDLIIGSQIQVIENYVNKYLNKARTSGIVSAKKEKINLKVVLEKMIVVFKKVYFDVKIDADFPTNEFKVAANKEDLEEIFGNILENACKWSQKRVLIKIVKENKEELRISINDDGPGLPKKKRLEVFDRGFRLDEQTPGTGLGLNIVKDTLENYSGKVWLEESQIGGLEVNVLFPLSI